MGISDDAILAYGISFDPEEWDHPQHDAIFAFFHKRQWWKLDDAACKWNPPVMVVRHCSSDAEMYVVAAADSVMEANRGFPKSITKTTLKWAAGIVGSEVIEKNLKRFCKQAKLPFSPPKWLLFSYRSGV